MSQARQARPDLSAAHPAPRVHPGAPSRAPGAQGPSAREAPRPWPRAWARSRGLLGGALGAGCLVLAACGGGGGGEDKTAVSGPGAAPAPLAPGQSYTVSGTISMNQSQTVDTDSNDPQQPGRRSNNSFDTAQPLPNPGLATGYLTVPGGGASGAVSAAGDIVDGYSVSLQPGQVIELDFSGNPRDVDVDLYLYDANRNLVGESIGVNSYECIQVTTAGSYTVAADLYVQGTTTGTLYQLRVGQPGSSSCPNSQVAAGTLTARGVIALPDPQSGSPLLPAVKAARSGLTVLDAGGSAQGGALLVQVPSDASTLARVLAANSTPDGAPIADLDRSQAKSLAVSRASSEWRSGLSEETRASHAAIDLAKSLARSGRYLGATPNRRVRPFADRMQPFPPNDRYYTWQRWHYEQISLPAAAGRLASFTPSTDRAPIVAVIDTGIVADHPDLQGQLVAGYDFITAPDNGDGDGIDANPDDSVNEVGWSYHGTHVAGTVAAQTYNSIGVAGVAPVARVMPIRVLGNSETGNSYWDLQQGIAFAAGLSNSSGTVPARRADVINLSLGASGQICDATTQDLINRARAAGAIVVAAAGNDSAGGDVPVSYPANCANVISVGALDAQRRRAPYSNNGPSLMVSAPGGDSKQQTTGTGMADLIVSTVAIVERGTRVASYSGYDGTSMAAPHVAGVIALIRWVNPAVTVATIEEWIRNGTIVDDVGAAGRDNDTGFGLINAEKAVLAALQSLGGAAPLPDAGQVSAQPSSLGLGSVGSTIEFTLSVVGELAERVISVTGDSNVISVAPKAGAVDAASGLGSYLVTANRAAMADNTTAFANVVVRLEPKRRLTIPVTIERRAGVGGFSPSAGPLYVLVIDAGSPDSTVVAQAEVLSASQGAYRYALTVPGTQRISVIAGSDLDNDGYVCNSGEACGAYPNLGSVIQVLEPTGNLIGVDFSISTIGGINAGSAVAASGLKAKRQ